MAVSKLKEQKVPVTARALLQRVNRGLAPDGRVVKLRRSAGHFGPWAWQPGDLYLMDVERNLLIDGNVALEGLARELGVLDDSEELID